MLHNPPTQAAAARIIQLLFQQYLPNTKVHLEQDSELISPFEIIQQSQHVCILLAKDMFKAPTTIAHLVAAHKHGGANLVCPHD